MPSLKDRDLNSTSEIAPANTNTLLSRAANRQQTVALEVPVTVNGARVLETADKREPFSESTKTLLVHGNGAVIRLASTVAPGQLLFLTNDKTKKEVVCQVVKSKTHSSSNGYVELQFTQPVLGFWGMRFPSDGLPRPVPSSSVETATAPERDVWADELSREVPPSHAPSTNTELAGTQPESLSTELKDNDRASSRADLSAALSETQSLKLEANRVQEQLASLVLNREHPTPAAKPAESAHALHPGALSDTTAKVSAIADAKASGENAPAATLQVPASKNELTSSSSLASSINASGDTFKASLPAEELKVPSWLEPLARNVATPTPIEAQAPPMANDGKNDGKDFPVAEQGTHTETNHAVAETKHAVKPAQRKAQTANAAPVFGNTLLPQKAAPRANAASHRALTVAGIAAAVLVAAAAGALYWQQSATTSSGKPSTTVTSASLPNTRVPEPQTPSLQAPVQAQNVSTTGEQATTSQSKAASVGVPERTALSSTPAQVKTEPAVMTERISKSNPTSNTARNTPPNTPSISTVDSPSSDDQAAGPEPAKPTLGKVHLARPKVRRSADDAGVDQPVLTETDAQPVSPDPGLSSVLASTNASKPAAPPVPVGGDAHPARLLSSVPPVYPQIAKAQHISGDVRIDALIDANGRVSSMKVVSGPALLHNAAMDAVRQWKYQPATLDGNAVPMHLTVTVRFHIE